jgi:transposase
MRGGSRRRASEVVAQRDRAGRITSDDSLSTADVALGYRQLAEVERAWRSLKSDLDLRPTYHHKADRIRAHVLLC